MAPAPQAWEYRSAPLRLDVLEAHFAPVTCAVLSGIQHSLRYGRGLQHPGAEGSLGLGHLPEGPRVRLISSSVTK